MMIIKMKEITILSTAIEKRKEKIVSIMKTATKGKKEPY